MRKLTIIATGLFISASLILGYAANAKQAIDLAEIAKDALIFAVLICLAFPVIPAGLGLLFVLCLLSNED